MPQKLVDQETDEAGQSVGISTLSFADEIA
jgi:hypothetical protein